jgi:hypothetical protein
MRTCCKEGSRQGRRKCDGQHVTVPEVLNDRRKNGCASLGPWPFDVLASRVVDIWSMLKSRQIHNHSARGAVWHCSGERRNEEDQVDSHKETAAAREVDRPQALPNGVEFRAAGSDELELDSPGADKTVTVAACVDEVSENCCKRSTRLSGGLSREDIVVYMSPVNRSSNTADRERMTSLAIAGVSWKHSPSLDRPHFPITRHGKAEASWDLQLAISSLIIGYLELFVIVQYPPFGRLPIYTFACSGT